MTDKNGNQLEVGDMVQYHERYSTHLGIVERFSDITESIFLKPVGEMGHRLVMAERVEKVDNKENK